MNQLLTLASIRVIKSEETTTIGKNINLNNQFMQKFIESTLLYTVWQYYPIFTSKQNY
ncbi:hypothetical protein ACFYKX_26960 [Cytobacillus sp. FJAT-54145]|uniref:Uncharacterized protein n=1 Tax=Cytobacillus spartinae TaxID=3299023 RepID=A0ABW6KJ30_9BACI